jgi:uncharacterized damage-inducible protein DinB
MASSAPFVTSAYVRAMAHYNAGMNARIYDAASKLSDDERKANRGAFWHSLHGTLSHLLWGDWNWMSRFDGWEKPPVGQKDSATMIADFDTLARERAAADEKISAWASRVDDAWLSGDLTWTSGTVGRSVTMPAGFVVMHFFNHQTHHRGQAHALITRAGGATGDTELMLFYRP